MSATVNWTEQGTRAVVSLPVPIAARLFGLPFLGFGLYFLRILVTGAMHPADMTIAGWTLVPLMMLAFLVPGWGLVFLRKRVAIDAGARTVVDESDFLVYVKRTSSPLLSDAHVMVRYELGTPGDDDSESVYWTHVYLVTGTPVLIGMFAQQESADADALARRAAEFLRVDLRDRRVERGEVNAGGVVVGALGPDEVA